jgi:uncharacterized protein with NRDE domain
MFAHRWRPDVPLVLAANRDELLDRPSEPPVQLQEDPPLWGGRDLLAGGTWLAVDPGGRICAVTNRHPGGRLPPRDATRQTRGRLPTDTLAGRSDDDARSFLAGLAAADYNPVNVLYLSRETAAWAGLDAQMGRQLAQIPAGIHVLTEQDPDEDSSPKTRRLLRAAQGAAEHAADADDLLDRFTAILRSHDQPAGPESAACIHHHLFGTVSSATVLVTRDSVRFRHAEGAPCVTAYRQVLG